MQNIECVFTDCIHNEHLENSIKGCCNAKDILIDFNKCASYEKAEGFKKRNLIKELRKCIDTLEVDSITYQEAVGKVKNLLKCETEKSISPCAKCGQDSSSCCGCDKYYKWKNENAGR